MTDEAAFAAPSDASGQANSSTSTVVDSSATSGTTPLETEQSTGGATAGAVQGTESPITTEDDPLAGVPSLDDLNKLDDSAQYKKSLIQMRTAIDETFKPLAEKFKPYEPFLERIQSPEDFQTALDLREKLFGWERDADSGRLVPATQSFAEDLAKQSPDTADFLAADLLNGLTRHPDTGQPVPRIDLALEAMAQDPERKAVAAQILGLVEPSSIAPTWQPSQEELNAILRDPDKPTPQELALQEVYKKMPWDEREELKLNNPEFIRKYLQREKQTQDLETQNRQAQERETRTQQQREQYIQAQAQNAGNEYVEKGFKEGFTEFANSIVAKSQFIQPIDPNSEVARQMNPQQLAQTNQQIQKVNQGAGTLVAVVTAALSHPDTQWVASEFLKGIGVDEKALQAYNEARQEYANNARSYGELNYQRSLGQNGNGSQPTGDLGVLQSNASRAMKNLKGQGNLISTAVLGLLSSFFEMKAGSYNQTLNGAAVARPPIQGQAFDPTTAASQAPKGWMSRQEIERQFGA